MTSSILGSLYVLKESLDQTLYPPFPLNCCVFQLDAGTMDIFTGLHTSVIQILVNKELTKSPNCNKMLYLTV